MKPQLIAACAAMVAVGAMVLGIPGAQLGHYRNVMLTASDGLADINDALLSLEGVSSPPATLPTTPLGEIADGNFYDVITSGTVSDGHFSPVDSTVAAHDLLNSSVVTGANQLAGIGYTNGYVGLSPTSTPDLFTFNDPLGVDFDHGMQALLTAFNQPIISLEIALNGTGNTPLFDPSQLNLDPADLGTDVQSLTMAGDWTAAFTDFSAAATLAF